MNMNVKSPSPPLVFFVKKCDLSLGSSKIYSDPPLCCVKFMLTLPFWAGKKLMTLPLNSSGPPPLLKNECSLNKGFILRILWHPSVINRNYRIFFGNAALSETDCAATQLHMVKLGVMMIRHIAAFGALEGSVLAHTCIMPFQVS